MATIVVFLFICFHAAATRRNIEPTIVWFDEYGSNEDASVPTDIPSRQSQMRLLHDDELPPQQCEFEDVVSTSPNSHIWNRQWEWYFVHIPKTMGGTVNQ